MGFCFCGLGSGSEVLVWWYEFGFGFGFWMEVLRFEWLAAQVVNHVRRVTFLFQWLGHEC